MECAPSHPFRPHRQLAAEGFTVSRVVEFCGVVVIGQDASILGFSLHYVSIGSFSVAPDGGVDAFQIWRMHKRKRETVRGNIKHAAVAVGMNSHAAEDGLQSFVQRGGEKILTGLQLPEGVDDERAAGAQDAADGSERLACQEM